jgi:hypothetical protein
LQLPTHGLAKLRLHTSSTLKMLKSLTAKLGTQLRHFAQLTKDLDVRETPEEYARQRKWAEANKASSMLKHKQAAHGHRNTTTNLDKDTSNDGRRQCTLNLNTYKMHALGDYVRTIEEYGTTDSYSTQIVSVSPPFLTQRSN